MSEFEKKLKEYGSENFHDEVYNEDYVRVPRERIGVLIGKKGETKKEIEERTKTHIDIDSESGEVFISSTHETEDPLAVWKARDVVRAIGRGFSPEKAFRLLDEGETLEVIDLTDILIGNDKHALPRVRGRIIGRRGRTREIIEEMSGAYVSVYGKTVAIIGNPIQVEIAKNAIEKLAKGSRHGSVYKYLERKKKDLELEEISYERI